MSENRKTDEKIIELPEFSETELGYQVQVILKPDAGVRVDTDYRLSSITDANLSSLEDILSKHDVKLERAFEETEDELEDLSHAYIITTKDKETAEAVAKDLSDNELVEEVEVASPAIPADDTPSFFDAQGYLGPAPEGIDAKYAWTFPGGKGTGIKLIDIEGAWNFDHEDLQDYQRGLAGGTMKNSLKLRNHGTNVLGVIGGDENDFGVTGIAPECDLRGYSQYGPFGRANISNAIRRAANLLQEGDIILIELQNMEHKCPVEYSLFEFMAIKRATSKGIIVVEAAGNGNQDLDSDIFDYKFNRENKDSGAILVGAGASPSGDYGPDRSRISVSNWGSIIDAQGWGVDVATTGGNKNDEGNLQCGPDENKWYRKDFEGTSSASAMVAGVIACLQGIRKAAGGPPLTYIELRNMLRKTGSPQVNARARGRPKTQRIGNRPDLRKLIPLILEFTLTVNIVGDGTVSKNPDKKLYSGDDVELTASPVYGWRFVGWSGDLTGDANPYNVTMDGNKEVIATFERA